MYSIYVLSEMFDFLLDEVGGEEVSESHFTVSSAMLFNKLDVLAAAWGQPEHHQLQRLLPAFPVGEVGAHRDVPAHIQQAADGGMELRACDLLAVPPAGG